MLHEAQRLCDLVAVINRGRLLAIGSPEELARDQFPGVRLIVKVDQIPEESIQRSIGQVEMVEEAAFSGKEIHLKIKKETMVPDLIQWLVAQNVRICAVAPQEVSLEEVYFTLQKRANGGVQ